MMEAVRIINGNYERNKSLTNTNEWMMPPITSFLYHDPSSYQVVLHVLQQQLHDALPFQVPNHRSWVPPFVIIYYLVSTTTTHAYYEDTTEIMKRVLRGTYLRTAIDCFRSAATDRANSASLLYKIAT
jgi:hypothetical protein